MRRNASTTPAIVWTILWNLRFCAALLALACSKPSANATAAAPETTEAAGAVLHAPPAPTTTAASPSPVAAAVAIASSAPSEVAVAPQVASVSVAAPSKVSPTKKAVKVVHIGMHIGGGPNDDITKEPIRASVSPHFDELSVCYAATGAKEPSDFGVDLLIPEAGGKAQVSHPRSTLKGAPAELATCIVSVFDRIDFKKPRTGRTVVSYSMRFTP
jgi:pyruvate/2-oxoglutarate dehydrogenase complex dihydrolipoamide acyltransferase (E2) component